MRTYDFYVYLITNRTNSVIYTGVTNDIERRMLEHKNKTDPRSFSARYNLNKLVYYEEFSDIDHAIEQEKKIKGGSRKKKEILINESNPNWNDLSENWEF